MLVDRSIPVGRDDMAAVVAWRRVVSVWLAGRLAGGLRGIVLFSETARVAEKADLEDSMCNAYRLDVWTLASYRRKGLASQ
jgi:hypothetical protein